MTTTLDEASTTASTDQVPPAYRWRWAAFFVLLAAEVMDLLDALITTIAGPSIRADLGGGASLLQWLGAGYTLAMAIGLVTGGRLGDLYGRRRMFLIGAAGFTIGSLLCAVAQSPEMLVGARVLQGLLGAVMIPQGLGMIKEMFPPKELAAAFGAFGPIMGLSTVAGPILAGWLITANYFDLGWRLIFLINLPLGLIAVLAGLRFLPRTRTGRATRLDLTGAALVGSASALLVYPLVQGREHGWPAWSFASMAASVVVFVLFGRYELRVVRRGADPLVTPSLFRKTAFTGGMITGLVFFAGLVGLSLVFSLYLQLGLGYSPLKTGLAGLPQSIGAVIGFVLAGAVLTKKFGRRLMHLGVTVMAVGVAGMAVTVHLAGARLTPWQLIPSLFLCGLGMAFALAPFFDIVLAGVEPEETGSAGGTLNAVQQFGASMGIAVLGTVFFDQVTASGILHAMQVTLWVEVALLALGFALTFLLPRWAREEASH